MADDQVMSSREDTVERAERIHDSLIRFAWWLAINNQDLNNPLMSSDEILGEVLFEMAKGLEVYSHLPDDKLQAVIATMMKNRVGELKYKYYHTHRRHASLNISIDVEIAETMADGGADPQGVYASKQRVQRVLECLSEDARVVLEALFSWDDRLANIVLMSAARANQIYKSGGTVKVRPHHLADALYMSERQVKCAFREIRQAYREVLDDEE